MSTASTESCRDSVRRFGASFCCVFFLACRSRFVLICVQTTKDCAHNDFNVYFGPLPPQNPASSVLAFFVRDLRTIARGAARRGLCSGYLRFWILCVMFMLSLPSPHVWNMWQLQGVAVLASLLTPVSADGIPEVSWYGTEGPFNIMVTQLLGPSLSDIVGRFKRLSLCSVMKLAIQMVRAAIVLFFMLKLIIFTVPWRPFSRIRPSALKN